MNTKNYPNGLFFRALLCFMLAAPAFCFSQIPTCIIRQDTDCVSRQITLEAWMELAPGGQAMQVTVPWSTGATAHEIVVSPPGTWSWDTIGTGCDASAQLNSVSISNSFFSDTLEIERSPAACPNKFVILKVNTHGYSFPDFEWNPYRAALEPYPVTQPGLYSLTVTDAFGCDFTDEISIANVGQGQENCYGFSCINCGTGLEGITGISNGPPIYIGGLCSGTIAVHNDQWFGFVAGSNLINIEVITSNCQDGNGLQMALFNDCSAPDAIACNAGCDGCGNMSMILEYTEYTPGETYWLMLDGFVSDVCDFEIHIIDGSTTAPVPPVPAQPEGAGTVCPGTFGVYSVPYTSGTGYYHWTAPPGALINGLSNELSLDAPDGRQVTVSFGAVQGPVCVQAGNACQELSAKSCLDVTFDTVAGIIRAPLTLCYEALPYTWDEAPYTVLNSPGVYELYSISEECENVVRQTVTIRPQIITTLPTEYICAENCPGPPCDSVFSSVVLESYLGCDSTVNSRIIYLNPIAEIQGPSQIFCEQNSVTLRSAPSNGEKTWLDAAGQIIGSGDTLLLTQSGTYVLTTKLTRGNVECSQSDTLVLGESPTVIDVQVEGATNGCSTDSLVLSAVVNVGNAQFLWTGPNGFNSAEQNPLITSKGTYTVFVTNIAGCSGSAIVQIDSIGGTPELAVLGDTITCIDITGQLKASVNTAGITFSWVGPDNYQSSLEDPFVNVAGKYILTITSAGGCKNTASTNIVAFQDIPTIEIFPPDIITCSEFVYIFSSNSALNPVYQWIGPTGISSNSSVQPAAYPGLYFLTVTELYTGCSATASVSVVEEPFILEVTTVNIVLPHLGGIDGSIDITVTGNHPPFTFKWFRNGNPFVFTEDIMNASVGFYRVEIRDSLGCLLTADFELLAASATNDVADLSPWIVQPNPGDGYFTVCCNETGSPVTRLSVFDSQGKLMLKQAVMKDQKTIPLDLNDAPSGLYFLEIKDETARSWWKKIIVK